METGYLLPSKNKYSVLDVELSKLQLSFQQLSINQRLVEKCINKVFLETSNAHNNNQSENVSSLSSSFLSVLRALFYLFKTCVKVVLIVGILYWFATSHNVTQKFIMRNSQSFIYPVMRSIRLWTLPLIRNYESFTDWHEEDCLVRNPFYYEPPLDCWPCEDVRTLVDLTGLQNYSRAYVQNEKPFIVRDVMEKNITLGDLQMMYKEQKIALERGTAKIFSSHSSLQNLADFLGTISTEFTDEFHVTWKINRVAAARVMRKTFLRPYFVPNTSEVALQRFLYISGAKAPQFFFPLTEFANVWIAQGQGYRLMVLDPSEPCTSNCSTVSVLLRPQDVLYYNWQFWRPRSLPAMLTQDISITYVGSFY